MMPRTLRSRNAPRPHNRRPRARSAAIAVGIEVVVLFISFLGLAGAAGASTQGARGLGASHPSEHAVVGKHHRVLSFGTLAECGGAIPPTNWNAVANGKNVFVGGAYGFVVDLTNIANWMSAYDGATYMPGEVSTTADLDYFGAIACRESTFSMSAKNGQYLGLFQTSVTDFSPILGSSCTAADFQGSGCDGFSEWQTQMIAGLYYCETHYGGNPYAGWLSEVFNGDWGNRI